MDLPVVIDSHRPDDRLGLAVPSHHHQLGADAAGSLASLLTQVLATRAVIAIVFGRSDTAEPAGFGEPNREPTATDSERR
jgi:hypothetical protein